MGRIQFPQRTQPVLAAPEQVTISRWQQPFSEPKRFKVAPGLAVALAAASGLTFNPASLPNVTPFADRYGAVWNEPVRIKPGLRSSLQQTLAFTPSDPFPESVSYDKFGFAWSNPPVLSKPLLRPASQQALAYIGADPFPEPPTYAKFGFAWSEPKRFRLGVPAQAQRFLFENFNEEIRYDKWGFALSEPVRLKPGLRVTLQQTAAFVQFPPFEERVSYDKFGFAWTEPVRKKPSAFPQAQVASVFGSAGPFPEVVFFDRWGFPWTLPVRQPRRVIAGAQPSNFLTTNSPIIDTGSWLFALSEPKRFKPALNAALQQYAVSYVIQPLIPYPGRTFANSVVRVRFLGHNVTKLA